MEERGNRQYLKQALLVALLTFIPIGTVAASTSTSTNYEVSETQFNAGMTFETCSAEYCALATIGDIATGQGAPSSEGSTTATFGSALGDDPLLEVIIEPGESNLGTLTTEKTSTKTTIIKIRSYLSDGYVLQITGDPPKYGDYQLRSPLNPEASSAGTEQFGINAVANTSPQVGQNPLQVPSSEVSFGEAEEGYGLADLFKYRSGDVVGRSRAESGQTDYTISMIVNVANNTPAGRYTGDFSAVVIPLF